MCLIHSMVQGMADVCLIHSTVQGMADMCLIHSTVQGMANMCLIPSVRAIYELVHCGKLGIRLNIN